MFIIGYTAGLPKGTQQVVIKCHSLACVCKESGVPQAELGYLGYLQLKSE